MNEKNQIPGTQPEDDKVKISKNTTHLRHGRRLVYAYLGLLFLAAIIGLASYVYRQHHQNKATKSNAVSSQTTQHATSTGSTDPYSGWKMYSNDTAGMTFKYPANWSSSVNATLTYADGSFGGISGVITSPSGKTLQWIYDVVGGKDGPSCTPNAGDTPFASGNNCTTKQILSVEQIPSVIPAPGESFRSLFEDNLYITKTKLSSGYTSPVTGKTVSSGPSYFICLDPYYKSTVVNGVDQNPQPQVSTAMGFELPCNWRSTGFNVTFPVADQADFNSADAKTAILIMKSFNSYSAYSSADAVNVVQSTYQDALNHVMSTRSAGQGEIDTAKDNLSPDLYSQLSANVKNSDHDQIMCAQMTPSAVTASLGTASGGVATVFVDETFGKITDRVTVTVDLASLKITTITCPQ